MRDGELFEVGVGGPAAGEFDESVPAAGEGKFELEADDAVIVVLDFSGKALAAFERQGLKGLFDRSALVADVGGSLLETGFGLAGREDLAELVEADLFADVELDEDQDGAAQGSLRLRRLLQLGGDVVGDDGCRFAIHGFAVITPDGLKRIVPSCGAAIGTLFRPQGYRSTKR